MKAYLFDLPFTEQFKNLHIIDFPGRVFNYISPNSHVLAQVLESATKKPLDVYADEALFSQMGHEYNVEWVVDKNEQALGFCGLSMSARDYLRFGMLALHHGQKKEIHDTVKQIGSTEWWQSATQPFSGGEPGSFKKTKLGYGLHWWIGPKNAAGEMEEDYAAIGLWGQFIYVDPKTNTVIVKTSVDNQFNKDTSFTALRVLKNSVVASFNTEDGQVF